MKPIDQILNKLADLIQQGRFVELETEGLEIKPVPVDGGEWKERHKSVNAFLNTRGGILILGVKEEGTGAARRYVLSGWKDHAEPNLKEFPRLFTDRKGVKQDLGDCFPQMELRTLLGERIAIAYVDELAADRKFVFLNGTGYRRILTGDHKLTEREVEAQEEFKEEAAHAKELQPVPDMTEADLDLTKLNQFIFHLNQPQAIETLKPDLDSARAFLERRCFLKDGAVTILGALVCGNHPGDRLGFRSHVHGYVDVPNQIAQDKQDFVDNVLQLMESSLGYLLRNIQVGISAEGGGKAVPQYPEEVLRETVNNALAHRDYSVDKQVIIAIKPGVHIAIRNPGRFRRNLIIEDGEAEIPVRRILPEAKPRNPKLADVLRVYRKWEGRGIGMATLVNLCLENRIDLPYYRIYTEEVCLHLCAGKLVGERMDRLFQSFDRHIEERLEGAALTEEQKLVLAYLIKSERANEQLGYTILLTPDNNHFAALRGLEQAGLIGKHARSTAAYPIYIADRVLVRRSYTRELRELFGQAFDGLDVTAKGVLGVVYRHNQFCKTPRVSAKQAAFALWYERGGAEGDIKQFDTFYRKVRNTFNKVEKAAFVEKVEGTRGYVLRNDYKETHLL
ncbi:MAG: ATP-dependent DNA helicase RecG [Limisphaerales bacterium]|jgi:ATP-dependent DNA helicase RecG